MMKSSLRTLTLLVCTLWIAACPNKRDYHGLAPDSGDESSSSGDTPAAQGGGEEALGLTDGRPRGATPENELDAEMRKVAAELGVLGLQIDLDKVSIEVARSDNIPRLDEGKGAWFWLVLQTIDIAFLGPRRVPLTKKAYLWHTIDQGAIFYADGSIFMRPWVSDGDAKEALAHELTHAFQDQQWGPDFSGEARPTMDQEHTSGCIREGHAVLVAAAMQMKRRGKPLRDVYKVFWNHRQGPIPIEDYAWVKYDLGREYLTARYLAGDLVLTTPSRPPIPSSMEQLIHPEKLGRDLPAPVTLPDWPERVAVGDLVEETTLGELSLWRILAQLNVERDEAYVAVTGWDGDRARAVKKADGTRALLWRIVFDRNKDALQFLTAIEGSRFTVQRRGRVLDLIYAEDSQDLASATAALAAHPADFPVVAGDAVSTAAIERSWARNRRHRSHFTKKTWQHPRYGLSIPIPRGWEKVVVLGQPLLGRRYAGVLTHKVTVNVELDLINTTLERYLARRRARSAKISRTQHSTYFHELVSVTETTVGGVPAGLLRQRDTTLETDEVVTWLVFRSGEYWVSLEVSVHEWAWPDSEADVKEMLRTVRIRHPK